MITHEKKFWRYFDITNFIITVILLLLGIVFVYSATYTPYQPYSIFLKKQICGALVGIGLYFLCCVIDYRTFMRFSYFGYLAILGVLFFTLIKGSIGMGAQRWINLGFVKVQPSELVKLLFPAFFTYSLHTTHDGVINPLMHHWVFLISSLFLSFLLICKQPDLGTALVILFSGSIMCWCVGIPKKLLRWGVIATCIAIPVLILTLKPYQKKRIAVYLGWESDSKDTYQIEQATIAVGSGGITGRGLFRGTQNKLRFLPEGRTDFIFAVVCEEWGLLGALFILLLYALLFYRTLAIIQQLNTPIMQLLGVGILIPFILSAVINMCMVLGLLPIVGIPLPLMSYGVSNLLTSLVGLGMLQNISMQRLYRRIYA